MGETQEKSWETSASTATQRRMKKRSAALLDCESRLGEGVSGVQSAERAVRLLLVNKDNPITQPVERSRLIDELADFLPKLQRANEEVRFQRENFPWMDQTTSPSVLTENAKKRTRAETESV